MRIGVVMSADGGALQKMLLPFRMGLGGRLGNGRQWWSWVSVDDVVGAIQHVLNNDSLQGPVNTVAPNPVTNAEFTRTLASVLETSGAFSHARFRRRAWSLERWATSSFWPASGWSRRSFSASGYQFQHPELRKALEEILKRK